MDVTFNLNKIELVDADVEFTLEGNGITIHAIVDIDNAASFAGKVLGIKEDVTPDKEKG